MKLFRAFVMIASFLLPFAQLEAANIVHKGDVVLIPVKGAYRDPSFCLSAALSKPRKARARCNRLRDEHIRWPLDSAEEITSILNHTTIPTYTFINSNAGMSWRPHRDRHAAYLYGAG